MKSKIRYLIMLIKKEIPLRDRDITGTPLSPPATQKGARETAGTAVTRCAVTNAVICLPAKSLTNIRVYKISVIASRTAARQSAFPFLK